MPPYPERMQQPGERGPEEHRARLDDGDDRVRDTLPLAPVFGLAGWDGPGMVHDWSFSGTRRVLAYARTILPAPALSGTPFDVQVHSLEGDVRHRVAELRMRWLARDSLRAGWERPVAALDPLPDRISAIPVEGSPEAFELWIAGPHWWAATTIGARTVVIEAHDVTIDLIGLERIGAAEVEDLLAERRRWLDGHRL
ncbi:hypothetical protein GCM10010988_10690 [Cnuibacter physcomitrellae]|nr:hypothetical protein GCM10010988_10690 [Cnuibacter physcomitrellae]